VIGFRTRTEEVAVRTFSGRATWYGPGFHGRRTANGERFDQMAMTAAHRSLAFGTRLRVCTRRRCVIVRVNDRGPFGRGNVLDLSKGAARRLGTEHSGVAWITATALQVRTVKVPVYAPVPAAPPGPVRRLRAERVSRPEPPTGTVVREEAVTAAPDLELVGDEQRWSALASAGAGLGGLLLLAVMALPAWHFRRRKGLTFVRTR
jgi:rare lipoprotein A (peptidoglycan hydrolase)